MNTTRTIRNLKPLALVLAGALVGGLFSDMLRPASALAQQDGKTVPPEKLLNSADQYRTMNASLSQINERLGRIESAINGGLKVRVTEMPAMPKDGK